MLLGPVSRKPRKAICEIKVCLLLCKADPWTCIQDQRKHDGGKVSQFRSLRFLFEDTRGFVSPEMRQKSFGAFEKGTSQIYRGFAKLPTVTVTRCSFTLYMTLWHDWNDSRSRRNFKTLLVKGGGHWGLLRAKNWQIPKYHVQRQLNTGTEINMFYIFFPMLLTLVARGPLIWNRWAVSPTLKKHFSGTQGTCCSVRADYLCQFSKRLLKRGTLQRFQFPPGATRSLIISWRNFCIECR